MPETTEKTDLLSPWTYYNDEFFELERDLIFRQNWLIIGHISDVPNAGDYLTLDAAGERALVIRGKDQQLRAFHNICRHRGAKVLDKPRGHCPGGLVCQFHGWSYHHDGSVRHIPKFETFSGVKKQDSGLVKLDMEIWCGFIFICFGQAKQSVAEMLSDVTETISPYLSEQAEPLPGTRYSQLRPLNWKIIHDIDNEGYHVPVGHPSLQQLYGKSYRDDAERNVSTARINDEPGRLWSVRHYQKILPRFAHLPEENQRAWIYIGIFPSMVIGFYPDMIEYYMSIPKSASESEYIGAAYGLPDGRRAVKLSRYLTQRINRITEQEDEKFMQWIQGSIRSSAFPELKLSSLESGVRAMHKKIQEHIPVATLAQPPTSGKMSIVNQEMLHNSL